MKKRIFSVLFSLVLVLSFSLVAAVPAMAATLTVTATSTSYAPGETATYTIGFTTATTYEVETVDMEFDTGFTGTAVLEEATGIGTGTLSPTDVSSTLTYTVDTLAVIGAGTSITIVLSGIENPSAGDYTVTVTTKSRTPAIVDTGTADVTIAAVAERVENIDTGETFATIQAAIDDAQTLDGHTITVGEGTYTPTSATYTTIVVDKELTIQAADGSSPVINAQRLDGWAYKVFKISANNVTIDGFTIVEDDAAGITPDTGIYVGGACENFVVQNNTVTGFDDGNDVGIRVEAVVLASGTSGLIKDNTLEDNSTGIEVLNSEYVTIQGNLSQYNGCGISLYTGSDHITVIENEVYSNTSCGMCVADGSSITRGTFHRNNIVSNAKGFSYQDSSWHEPGLGIIDAENNWWGDETGPYITATNPSGMGDVVSAGVDYRPWSHEPYGVEEVTTISLEAGWNLVSLPLTPTSSAITDVLADVSSSVTTVRYYNSLEDPSWLYYDPDVAESTLDTMEDGLGYWIKMSAAATLDVSGTEMPEAPALPHTYSVVEEWNLVGFKSTTPMPDETYLGNLEGAYSVLYGYDAVEEGYFSVYPLDEHSGNMEPGCGYWLWATEDGTIVPPR